MRITCHQAAEIAILRGTMPNETQMNDELALRRSWMDEAHEQTLESLPAFLRKLADFDHSYGTIPRAIAAAALGAAWAMNRDAKHGGITGFQASFVMWDFIQGWRRYEDDRPLKLVDYEQMLYPQYESTFAKTITRSVWVWLQKRARAHLDGWGVQPAANVQEHWQRIATGTPPFGYTVVDD